MKYTSGVHEYSGWVPVLDVGKSFNKTNRNLVIRTWEKDDAEPVFGSKANFELLDDPTGVPFWKSSGLLASMSELRIIENEGPFVLVAQRAYGMRIVGWIRKDGISETQSIGDMSGGGSGVAGGLLSEGPVPSGTCLYDHSDLGSLVGKTGLSGLGSGKVTESIEGTVSDLHMKLNVDVGFYRAILYARRVGKGLESCRSP